MAQFQCNSCVTRFWIVKNKIELLNGQTYVMNQFESRTQFSSLRIHWCALIPCQVCARVGCCWLFFEFLKKTVATFIESRSADVKWINVECISVFYVYVSTFVFCSWSLDDASLARLLLELRGASWQYQITVSVCIEPTTFQSIFCSSKPFLLTL